MKVDIASIIVGGRHRKEMGDLEQLAESIADLGLLQPIGITDSYELIFGERRLRACRDVLGLTEIEARVVDMPNIVVGENAENEVRKDFTPSERVAIAQAIEVELSGRQGQRSDLEHVQKIAQVARGRKTRDFAAKKAGFGNHETYRQAKHVVENAEPEVVAAMDNNVVSISQARKISNHAPEVQRTIIKTGRTVDDLERERANEYRKRHSKKHPELKVQTITDAVTEIATCEMTAAEFKAAAGRVTMKRFQSFAFAAHAFLKPLVEGEGK